MAKQKLTFKIDGGLEKISRLYASAESDKQALNTYGENPAALLEALSVTPEREIRLSAGYRKLAETMDTIDLSQWHDAFEPQTEKHDLSLHLLYLST